MYASVRACHVTIAFTLMIILTCGACSVMNLSNENKKNSDYEMPHISYTVPANDIRKVVLPNGMTILAYRNPVIPKVLVQIGYDKGSAVEEGDEHGLAHLLEHMIFKGTQKLKEGDIDGVARKYGATFNAFTSKDMTSYYFEVDRNNWKVFLPILADCMQNARFEEQHLASELLAVIQELKMYRDKYWSRMIEKASELAYPANHPYHYSIIGYKEDLAAMSSERLHNFYKKYYHPDSATLLIMGDIDLDEAVREATEQFGSIPKGENAPGQPFPHMVPDLVAHKTRIYEVVQKEQLGFYWVIPGTKYMSTELLAMITNAMGGGEGSRLYKRLVDEDQIADGVNVDAYHLLESGIFLVLIEPKDGKIDACRKVVQEEFAKLIKDGVTPAEMEKTIVSEASSFFQLLTELQSFSYEWLASLYATRDEMAVFKKIDHLYEISPQEIQDFAAQYLDPFMMNQIELVPLPEAKKEIWQKAKLESEAVDREILAAHKRTEPIETPEYVNTLAAPTKLDFSFPKPARTFKLPNGFEVMLYKRDQIPLVNLSCTFRDSNYLGSTLEGVATDLMMNMLTEGATDLSKQEIVDFFEHAGAEYNFGVSGGSLSTFSDNYAAVIKRFAHVLQNPAFNAKAFAKIKAQAVESYVRAKDSHIGVARKMLKNAIYKDHPYAWTFDDAIELLKGLTVADLKASHDVHLSPARMVIGVAGSFDLDEMEKTITEIFGAWPAGEPYQQRASVERHFVPGQNIDEQMLRDQAVLLMGQPSELTLFHPDYVPMKMLNFIAFNSLGSRLYAVRERTGLFYNAQGAFGAGCDREKGYDYIMAILNPENLTFAEEQLRQVIEVMARDGVTEQEVAEARQLYLKGLIDLTVHTSDIAGMFTSLTSLGLPFDYYDTVLARVQSLTVAELNDVARRYFDGSRMTRVRVGRVSDAQ